MQSPHAPEDRGGSIPTDNPPARSPRPETEARPACVPAPRSWAGSAVVALLAGMLCVGRADAEASPAERFVTLPAETFKPGFSLKDADGTETSLEKLRGRPVLVHFFATWCEPCREELPALDRLARRAEGRLSVVAISVAEPAPRVRRFFAAMPVSLPVLLDFDMAVARAWQAHGLPSTYVLDAGLNPRLFTPTEFDWEGVDPDRLLEDLSSGPDEPVN